MLSSVSAEHPAFSRALHFETNGSVSNIWDARIEYTATDGVNSNDVLLVAFHARCLASPDEFGDGRLVVRIGAPSTNQVLVAKTVIVGKQWKPYYISTKSKTTLSKDQLAFSIRLGVPEQTLEIADIQFLNYRQSKTLAELPVTEITYHGREPDAPWRSTANERINQLRKGPVELIIQDRDGKPVKDAIVSVEMTRHAFGFGTAFDARTFRHNETYRETIFENFNEVVFENDLKWGGFERSSKTELSAILDIFHKKEIPVRGHNVIWPSYRWSPDRIEELGTNSAAIRAEIDQRIDRVTQFTKGRLNDWDVINEPYSEKDIQAVLGDAEMAYWFKRTRENDPNVKCYINDYSIIGFGGRNVAHQDGYFDIINLIDAHGGQIDGIGMQGHFDESLTPITKAFAILDRFAALDKEIKITEFDINTTQREVQANYTRDFMTICFSHPSVKSIMAWGFWEGRHWRPNAAFFSKDWKLMPHGEAWFDQIFNTWWTREKDLETDRSGKTSFEGFLGSYTYRINHNGKECTGTFQVHHAHQAVQSNTINIIWNL